MNLVTGKDFDLLKHRAINVYGARDLNYSNRKKYIYMVTLKNGNKIHLGDRRYQDYLSHQDWKRRIQYRKRASKIKNKDGELTYRDPNYANFGSYHLLW